MRIDSHVHVWSDGSPPFTYSDGMTTSRPDGAATVERLIESMDQNGIDMTILVQCFYHGYDNSYLCHSMGRFPDRLKGVALLDTLDPGAADELERLYREHGVQGMRLYPVKAEDASWLCEDHQIPLWERARDIGVPFIWFGWCRQIPFLRPMLEKFPEVPVIIDHMALMGEPNLDEGVDGSFQNLLKLSSCPNVYVKPTGVEGISKKGWPYDDVLPYVKAVYETFGAQRLIGSSEFPFNPGNEAALVEGPFSFFTKDDQEWINGKTAAKIYC
jgi:predicted TIM-barrel fold metal-dependent hydrolase